MNQYYSQWSKEELDSMNGIEIDDLVDENDLVEEIIYDDEDQEEEHPISLWSLGMSYKDFM